MCHFQDLECSIQFLDPTIQDSVLLCQLQIWDLKNFYFKSFLFWLSPTKEHGTSPLQSHRRGGQVQGRSTQWEHLFLLYPFHIWQQTQSRKQKQNRIHLWKGNMRHLRKQSKGDVKDTTQEVSSPLGAVWSSMKEMSFV